MQGARILRNEAYFSYAAMTKDEVQHSRMTFYEAVNNALLTSIPGNYNRGISFYMNRKGEIYVTP